MMPAKLLLTAALTFVAAYVSPAWLQAAEMQTRMDVAYAEPRNERQLLDVYAPVAGRNLPVVIWIHGGGMSTGSKKEVDVKPRAFVEKGYVFVSTNYRFATAATLPQIASDIAKATRWVHEHAGEFGGDPRRLIVAGHSAGGQLAALVCTNEGYLQAEGVPLTNIKACVPVDGRFGSSRDSKEQSPIQNVAKGKGLPAFLLLYTVEHPQEAERFSAALRAAENWVEAYAAEGTDHMRLNTSLGKVGDKPTERLFEFLGRVLGK